MEVTGREHVSVYAADRFQVTGKEEDRGKKSHHERNFCKHCACYLWAFSSRWPRWVYPFANSLDVELPVPPSRNHFWMSSKVAHMPVDKAHEPECRHFDGYPDSGIADWHKKHGLTYGPPEDEG
mmetsp:Transcript_28350/g.58566  ORF Transcript_28350/g.58566 Transcript_28350/m.58566 type:complete len:124 (-) Transcript_28350:95-466(-)